MGVVTKFNQAVVDLRRERITADEFLGRLARLGYADDDARMALRNVRSGYQIKGVTMSGRPSWICDRTKQVRGG